MEQQRHDEILEKIDDTLDSPPVSMEEALNYAVENGHMTIRESEQCLEAYQRAFLATQEQLG